jgi:hypothetical protein
VGSFFHLIEDKKTKKEKNKKKKKKKKDTVPFASQHVAL